MDKVRQTAGSGRHLEKQHNMLNHQKMFQVAKYLDLHRERIVAERPLKHVLAAECTKSLGFLVTAGNIVGACKAAGV